MKKKLSTFVYPIIAACICFVIGIVMFSVALALKWGTTSATLQLYAWFIFAAICAVLAVVLKFCPANGQAQGSGEQNNENPIAPEIENTLSEIQALLKKIEPTISESKDILSELRTIIIGDDA